MAQPENQEVSQDISDRKRSELILRENEERFRLLIEQASDMIGVIDHSGTIRFQSPSTEHLLGYPPAEMVGHSAFEFVHPDDAAQASDGLRKAVLNPGTVVTIEYRVRHRNGQWRILQTSGRSLPAQAPEGFIVLNSRDLTESRQLEEQLLQSQKMEAIGQLAGGVAHDFNNILAAMIMQVELTQSTTSLAEAKDALKDIRALAERAANLTKQLLLFSRRQVMQPHEVELNEIVTHLVKMLQRIIGEDVRLQLRLYTGPLRVRADKAMIEQVLLNLAVNARDAMPNGGQLIIETSLATIDAAAARQRVDLQPGRYARLTVTDNGSGIAADLLPHIFEPFFTTKEPGKGTGLGLATVFGIVKQHHGSVTVQSKAGFGATFEVYLPACEPASGLPPLPSPPPSPRGAAETILLVEDDSALRCLTRTILERQGYNVLEAANGAEALQLWAREHSRISLLFTDLVMPGGLNGHELAARLHHDAPDLKTIYVSGYSADIAGQELELKDSENFLQKPYPPRELLETLRRCLDRSH